MICYKDKLKMVLLNSKKPLIIIKTNYKLFIAPILSVSNFDNKLKVLTDKIDNELKNINVQINVYNPAPSLFKLKVYTGAQENNYYKMQLKLIFKSWKFLLRKKDSLKKDLINSIQSAEDVILTAIALKYLNKVFNTKLSLIRKVIQPYNKLLNQSQKRMLKTGNF